MRYGVGAAVAAVWAASVGGVAMAAPPAGVRQYAELALSGAGDRIAAVESVAPLSLDAPPPHATVVIRDARTGAVSAVLDPCPTCDYAEPAWSPDGLSLAFVSVDDKAKANRLQVWRGGQVRTLLEVKGLAGTPRWSPDGARLAFLAVENAHKKIGATEAGVAIVGEIGSAPDEQRIGVVPAEGGVPTYVSPADTFVYEYDWTPDGRGFVATAAQGDGDNNWWVARLVAVDASGGPLREIAAPKTQANFPRVSPDGRTVAFIGGLMSDFGSVGGDVYTVPLAGGAPRNLTPGYKGSFTSLGWVGGALHATAQVGDQAQVVRLDAQGRPTTLWSRPLSINAGDLRAALSRDGASLATAAQDFEHAPYILAGPVARPQAITHDNDAATSPATARSLTWSSDGQPVQGWLLTPTKLGPGAKHPMITLVHGGPSAASTPTFLGGGGSFAARALRTLLERGYFVFEPNPRGSYGQGEAFTRANVRDLGGGDLRDVLAGIDAVEKVAPVDEARLGVMGHSYGGFMTMWTVTHSTRFKAAVGGAGIANWVSYYGQNGIDQWMVPFFGATAYDDPAIYDKLSPIRSIKAARTPTLLYVGERDVECPPAQSIEFWHGLRAMNVATTLVIYDGEGHRLRRPDHVRDYVARVTAWFDQYLGVGAAPPN